VGTLRPPPGPGAKAREDETLRGIPVSKQSDDEVTGVGPDPRVAHEMPTPAVGTVQPVRAPAGGGAAATLRPAPFMPVPPRASQPPPPARPPAGTTLPAPGADAPSARSVAGRVAASGGPDASGTTMPGVHPAPRVPSDTPDEGGLELDETDELAELAAVTLPPAVKSWPAWPAPADDKAVQAGAAEPRRTLGGPPRPAPDARRRVDTDRGAGTRDPRTSSVPPADAPVAVTPEPAPRRAPAAATMVEIAPASRPAPASRSAPKGQAPSGRARASEGARGLRLSAQDSSAPPSASVEFDEPIALPKQKGPGVAIAVILGLAVVGGIVWFAFGGASKGPSATKAPSASAPAQETAVPSLPMEPPAPAEPAQVPVPPSPLAPAVAVEAAAPAPAPAAAVVAEPPPTPPAPAVAAPVPPPPAAEPPPPPGPRALAPRPAGSAPKKKMPPRPKPESSEPARPAEQPLWDEPVIQIRPSAE
jgi:hypothetical protein